MRTITKYLSVLMVMLSILVIASQSKAQTTLLTEGWESTVDGSQVPPAGWATDVVTAPNATYFLSTGNHPTVSPYEGSRLVDFNSYTASSGTTNRLRRTVPINTLGWTNLSVDLAWFTDSDYPGDVQEGVTVQWSTNGTTWNNADFFQRTDPTNQWVIRTSTLPAGASATTLYIAFSFYSQYGNDCHMDIIHLKGTPPPSGTLTGTVTNCLTNAPIPNATVNCNNISGILTNASGVYTLPGVYAGYDAITATATNYTPYSGTVTVVANTTTTYNFCMYPLPGLITGIVTNASNGNPVVGALISWGSATPVYSTAGGAYTLTAYAAGTNTLTASKPGFNTLPFPNITVTVPAPPSTVQNIALMEDTPPPSSPFTAALNSGQTAVNLNWGLPVDDMVLIYDDGIQDNFAIWGTGNDANMNAMKFTPISYPATVKQFQINIGTAANYAAGANPFKPIDIDLYDEVGGLPGTSHSHQSITPLVYGWTGYITLATPYTLTSGNFYIVVSQVGSPLLSPGLAVDTTVQQLRSYSKFGTNPWIPGPGNFMIRAVVNGSGGPLKMIPESGKTITASAVPGLIYQYKPGTVTGVEGSPKVYPEMGYNPETLVGYQIWRLTQGQEGTPALWTSVGTPTTTTFVDNSYPSLPCGGYRWAAEAQYTFNRWSTAIFSSAVGKCWTCTVTLNVAVSCDSTTALGTQVTFRGIESPDTVYSFIMPATGTYVKTNFWKGDYTLTLNKVGYTLFTQTYAIFGDMTINATLLQFKTPPTNLDIYPIDALATWDPPVLSVPYFTETFSTGFGTNGWVADAGSNWGISLTNGNPGACAEWNAVPEQTGYSQSLTSATMTGRYSAFLKLQYDIQLSAVGNTTLEEMAVEVWNGSTWYSVKNYDNSTGNSIPYTTESIDITSHAPNTGFKIRFRAHGADSQWINYWDIDNVKLVAQTDPRDPCIVGYNFTLNGVMIGFTRDTFFHIPPSQMVYGTSYTGCVYAIYGSGYSTPICENFTNKFLCPPTGLNITNIECTAYLTWVKPNCGGCTLNSYVEDNGSAGDGYSSGNNVAGQAIVQLGNFFNIATTAAGTIKSFDMCFSSTSGTTSAQPCVVVIYDAAYNILGQSDSFINTGGAWPVVGPWINVPVSTTVNYNGPFYAMVDYSYTSLPEKNWFAADINTTGTGFPHGYGYTNFGGVWLTAYDKYSGTDPAVTFLQRANVCVNDKNNDGPITTIDPSKLPQGVLQPANTSAKATAVSLGTPASGVPVDPPTASPLAPQTVTLTSYDIYRNDAFLINVPGANTLSYYDYNLNPGTYKYSVAGRYNVAPIVPNFADSRADSANVNIECGYPLPFYEPWSAATGFAYQNWTFSPNQSNWSFNTAVGDPTPCADFSWSPIITNYSSALVSPTINASAYSCANIYLDVDVKLIDRNNTGTEKLDIDVLVNGVWTNKAELADSGSYDWTLKHITINSVMGKAFQVRFRANGASTSNILHWYVDNIHIYAVCIPPTGLQGRQNQFITHLTWHSPKCPSACTLKNYTFDDGTIGNTIGINTGYTIYQGNIFPISATASGVIKSFDCEFSQYSSETTQSCILYVYNSAQTLIGQSAPFMNGPAATYPSGTFINVPMNDLAYTGPFYAMVDFTVSTTVKNGFSTDVTTVLPAYPNGLGYGLQDNSVWTDATTLFGLTTPATYIERANVCESSSKDKDAPITTIDPTKFGKTPVHGAAFVSGPAPAGSVSINYNDPSQNNHGFAPQAPAGSLFKGYNVYRTDDGNLTGPFHIVNLTGPLAPTDTVYAETHPSTTNATSWKYYVTAYFEDSLNLGQKLCESSSDTITIIFPAVGIPDLSNESISLYPNPANDLVNIVSTNDIKSIEVLNYIGQTIYKANDVNLKATKLEVSTFTAGVYFVKITTSNGIKTTKITVTH